MRNAACASGALRQISQLCCGEYAPTNNVWGRRYLAVACPCWQNGDVTSLDRQIVFTFTTQRDERRTRRKSKRLVRCRVQWWNGPAAPTIESTVYESCASRENSGYNVTFSSASAHPKELLDGSDGATMRQCCVRRRRARL